MGEENGQRIARIVDAWINYSPPSNICPIRISSSGGWKMIIDNKASASSLKCVPATLPWVGTKSLNLS